MVRETLHPQGRVGQARATCWWVFTSQSAPQQQPVFVRARNERAKTHQQHGLLGPPYEFCESSGFRTSSCAVAQTLTTRGPCYASCLPVAVLGCSGSCPDIIRYAVVIIMFTKGAANSRPT